MSPKPRRHKDSPLLDQLDWVTVPSNLHEPLHVRVRQLLRQHILNDFEDGQKFHSERELIAKLKVSQPTIHRALNDLADEKYLVASPRKGFFVRKNTSMRYIGMFVPAYEAADMARLALYDACLRRQIYLNIHYVSARQDDKPEDIFKRIKSNPSEERMIFCGLSEKLALQLHRIFRNGGYECAINGPTPQGFAGKSIALDQEHSVKQILSHLTKLGHEKITFIVNEPDTLLLTRERYRTVQRFLASGKYPHAKLVNCHTALGENSFDAAYKVTEEIFSAPKSGWPTALCPLSTIGAWAAQRYFIKNGIRIPSEVSLLSFDPIFGTDYLPYPITTLAYSYKDWSEAAVELLWGDSKKSVNHVAIKTDMRILATTAKVPSGKP